MPTKIKTAEDRVREQVAIHLCLSPDQIKLESNFIDDLAADSIDLLELVMGLEEEIGSDITDEDAEKWKTVGDVVNYVEAKTKPDGN